MTDNSKTSQKLSTHFDLIANISHEGKPGKGSGIYKVHVQNRGKEQWYQIQDLIVEEINAQMIFLSESYIQVNEEDNGRVIWIFPFWITVSFLLHRFGRENSRLESYDNFVSTCIVGLFFKNKNSNFITASMYQRARSSF